LGGYNPCFGFPGIRAFGIGVFNWMVECVANAVDQSFATTYLPVQRAYVSDQVSYKRRGRALPADDASFSTEGMVGLPIIG
jgi:hypothetical protein